MNLRLLQLGDSALPIGGYSHSWGLEAAVDQGQVSDAAGLEGWIRAWLRYAAAPLEGVVVASVGRAAAAGDWQHIGEANELLSTSLSAPTLRQASRHLGEQLLGLAEGWDWAAGSMAKLRALGAGPWHHAPVFAILAAAAGAPPLDALLLYLHQAALGLISAGVRAIPIGHSHGQQVLVRLQADLQMLAQRHAERELTTAGSFCPAYEVLCYVQSRLYTRLFRS